MILGIYLYISTKTIVSLSKMNVSTEMEFWEKKKVTEPYEERGQLQYCILVLASPLKIFLNETCFGFININLMHYLPEQFELELNALLLKLI